jgi:hypothetical protein
LTNRRPIYLGHFFHFLVYSIVYLTFTGVFYLAGGTTAGKHYVYWFLDWHKPHVVFMFVPLFAVIAIVYQCLLVGLVRMRDRLWRSCTEKYRDESHLAGDVSVPKGKKLIYTLSDHV